MSNCKRGCTGTAGHGAVCVRVRARARACVCVCVCVCVEGVAVLWLLGLHRFPIHPSFSHTVSRVRLCLISLSLRALPTLFSTMKDDFQTMARSSLLYKPWKSPGSNPTTLNHLADQKHSALSNLKPTVQSLFGTPITFCAVPFSNVSYSNWRRSHRKKFRIKISPSLTSAKNRIPRSCRWGHVHGHGLPELENHPKSRLHTHWKITQS